MSQDPKYTFTHKGIWHNEGCYYLPEDEPVMLLRGKDHLAIRLVQLYRHLLSLEPRTDIVASHLVTSQERLEAFTKLHIQHPDRVGVCCSSSQKRSSQE